MIDHAAMLMAGEYDVACERIAGINDNMSHLHNHRFFELYYLEDGERFHMLQVNFFRMEKDEFVIFPPLQMHYSYGEKDTPFRRIVLYFSENVISDKKLLAEFVACGSVIQNDSALAQSVHSHLEDILASQQADGAWQKEYAANLVSAIVIETVRCARSRLSLAAESEPNVMDQIISYINENYATEITVKGIAEHFFISEYYMCRRFKKYTSQTIVRYLNITRIINAQRMIFDTSENFTEISRKCGFNNLTHFNRIFRSVLGLSPSEFKKVCHRIKKESAYDSQTRERKLWIAD
jgi:YesN/AraC family two-component response regulator